MGLFQAERSIAGLCRREVEGSAETSQTHRVRMNFRPEVVPTCPVLHSRKASFFEPVPTAGFATTASLN